MIPFSLLLAGNLGLLTLKKTCDLSALLRKLIRSVSYSKLLLTEVLR